MQKNIKRQQIKADIDNVIKMFLALEDAIEDLAQENIIREMYFDELSKAANNVRGILNDMHPIIGFSVVLEKEELYEQEHECK